MRMRSFCFLVAVFCLFLVTPACAGSEDISEKENVLGSMQAKLGRGVVNTFTGWMEFPYQIVKGFNDGFMGEGKNKLFGVIFGGMKGIAYGAGRTTSGLADLVFFWAANPRDNIYVGIPLDAEYAWEEGVSYDMFDPDFTEAAIRPMVNKLFRGVGNTLFGFVEVPQQIKKGFSRGAWDLGISRGLWFWMSREISGVVDIATVPCANPEYNVGVAFDEDMPWEVFFEKKRRRDMER